MYEEDEETISFEYDLPNCPVEGPPCAVGKAHVKCSQVYMIEFIMHWIIELMGRIVKRMSSSCSHILEDRANDQNSKARDPNGRRKGRKRTLARGARPLKPKESD
ncbi:hypothetical protein SAY87_012059 [Trapa incisa]|uniref:Uncharacterized protein n=1 Tax=Trapa incisa TaxID=236973 RepID=A0AAN7JJ86_9MYRT|nr:hypothetical protein SAY87_012059 [Trapa incisa]